MKEKHHLILKTCLIIGDVLSLLTAFGAAYIIRVKFIDRPIITPIASSTFITSVAVLIPLWIVLFNSLNLYNEKFYRRPASEMGRLFVASILGVMVMISYSYFTGDPIFPAKLVTVYSLLISFLLLTTVRNLIHTVNGILLSKGLGCQNVLVVGNTKVTNSIIKFLTKNPHLGYQIQGIVANNEFVDPKFKQLKFSSASKAIKSKTFDLIIDTDLEKGDELYNLAINNHLNYSYIPSHNALNTSKHTSQIIDVFPLVWVHQTPLMGYGKVVKRTMDIVGGLVIAILSSPIWLISMIIIKISEPKAPIFFKQKRLTRDNKIIYIYKFRSMSPKYSGMTPEQAFTKMGRPELIEQYRANGDQIDNDPRITKVGAFLRRSSIDELPQLLNVIKGDISLIGPRALIPQELKGYKKKHLILSVKSGLTGLAQVSGRRDISFEERRRLDVYYVQNWSLWLDIKIVLKTIWYVLAKIGAK